MKATASEASPAHFAAMGYCSVGRMTEPRARAEIYRER